MRYIRTYKYYMYVLYIEVTLGYVGERKGRETLFRQGGGREEGVPNPKFFQRAEEYARGLTSLYF